VRPGREISRKNVPSVPGFVAPAGRWNASERFCTDRIIPLYERYYHDVLNG